MSVAAHGRYPTRRAALVDGRMPQWTDPVTQLLLAAEVLSPLRHDRITKRRFFQRHGVPEYWVVDGEAEAFTYDWWSARRWRAMSQKRLLRSAGYVTFA